MKSFEKKHGATFNSAMDGVRLLAPGTSTGKNSKKQAAATKANNWSTLLPILHTCGVTVDTPTKGRILHGDLPAALGVMAEFRKQLLLQYPPKNKYKTTNRVSIRERQKQKQHQKPERDKHETQVTHQQKQKQKQKKQRRKNGRPNSSNGNDSAHSNDDHTPRSVARTSTNRTKGDHDLDKPSGGISPKQKQFPHFEVDPSRLAQFADTPGTSLHNTQTLFEFMVMSLSKSLSAHPVQVYPFFS